VTSALPPAHWVPALPPDVRVRKMRGRLLVARRDESVQLEDVSAAIFARIDGTSSAEQIGQALCAQYEVDPPTAVADTVEFLGQLVELGILDRGW